MIKPRSIGIVVAIILIVSIVAGTLIGPLTFIGPSDKTIDLTTNDGKWHLGKMVGHVTLDDTLYATGYKPDDGVFKSEKAVLTNASIKFDMTDRNIESGLFTQSAVSIVSYRINWYVNSELKQEGPLHPNTDIIVQSGHVITVSTPLDDEFVEPIAFLMGDTKLAESSDVVVLGLFKDPIDTFYQVIGDPLGLIKCEIIVDYEFVTIDTVFYSKYEREVTIFGQYQGELISGKGAVLVGGQGGLPDVAEVGKPFSFMLQTGFSDGRGWEVNIHPPFSRTDLTKLIYQGSGFNGQDDFGPKQVTWIPPDDWFTPGGDNQCRITLSNGLFTGDMTTFFVVDDITKIPEADPGNPTGVIQDVKGNAIVGEQLEILMRAVPNSDTQSPIDYFVVYVYYGEPGHMPGPDFLEQFILYNVQVDADDTGFGSVTFIIPDNRPGFIAIKANAVDEAGRASLGDFWSMKAVFPGEIPDPPAPDPVDYPFTWTLAAYIILFILLIVISVIIVILYIYRKLALKWYFWVIVGIIVAALSYAIYFVGKNPGWSI